MDLVKKKLKKAYVEPINVQPEMLIGIELELPIESDGSMVDTEVTKGLLKHLLQLGTMTLLERDKSGVPIAIQSKEWKDVILFEVSYNTIEIAFAPVVTIEEAEERFNSYMNEMNAYLNVYGHKIVGEGINPQWATNDNQAVASPRYQMLMDYLALSRDYQDLHQYPDYGAFICGNQVQLDVSKENYIQVINVFNQIEAAKAYLFGNSPFPVTDWDTKVARDRFWEESMHGLIKENAGLPEGLYENEEAFLDQLSETSMFTVQRKGEYFYFRPIKVKDYFNRAMIEGYNLEGNVVHFKPEEGDLESHRAYQFQSLTRRGTVEFRSVCAQPLEDTFAPVAFHVGIMQNLQAVTEWLDGNEFFMEFGCDLRALRRKFSKLVLNEKESESISKFAQGLLDLAIEGLVQRGFSEETYLTSFRERNEI